jgi:hypothetical protein
MNIDKLYHNIVYWHDNKELPEVDDEIIVTGINQYMPYLFCKFLNIAGQYFLQITTLADAGENNLPIDKKYKTVNLYYIPFKRCQKWMYVKDFKTLCE